MNWQQRSGQIYANLMEPGLRAFVAAATGIAKAACIGLCKRLSVAISPESLWEHPVATSGLVWAVVYVFRSSNNVVRILPYFAFRGAYRCFPMPCRVRAQIEQLLNYRDEQQAQLQQRQARVEVCGGR